MNKALCIIRMIPALALIASIGISPVAHAQKLGWNDYFYKVVKKGPKIFSVEECKQSDRPYDGWIASARLTGENIVDNEPQFLTNSLLSILSFTLKEKNLRITQYHFSGTSGDLKQMHKYGAAACKAHFAKSGLSKFVINTKPGKKIK